MLINFVENEDNVLENADLPSLGPKSGGSGSPANNESIISNDPTNDPTRAL